MIAITRIKISKNKIFLGKGVKELLDAIEEFHSIKKATEATGISYPKAIRMLKTLEQELGYPAVISEKGGHDRGGTQLTKEGKDMLERYRKIEKKVEEFAQSLVDIEFPD